MFSPTSNSKLRSPKFHSHGEEGYLLVGMLFMVALILLTLAIAAPKVAVEIQRDKEQELVHRGMQYARAIRLYYKKFGRYPLNVSQLENSNNIRFLRRKYKDPFTGKDEWRVIHFGEAKVPTMGLFGQALPTAGAGGTGTGTTTTNSLGSLSPSSMGSNSFSSSPSTISSAGTTGSTGSTGTDSTSSPSGSIFGNAGTTTSNLGGGLMIGVASTSTKASIMEYKKQKHYNEWEFVYDPQAERLLGGTGTGIAAQPGAPPNTNPGIGSGSSSIFGNGASGAAGSTGSTGTGSSPF